MIRGDGVPAALTRPAMANQSSHQNLCFFSVNLDQTRINSAIVGRIIMAIQNAASAGPRFGSGDDAIFRLRLED